MFYFFDTIHPLTQESQRHILSRLPDGGILSWPLTDDNPNKAAYDEWLAAGNTPEPWNPEQENK